MKNMEEPISLWFRSGSFELSRWKEGHLYEINRNEESFNNHHSLVNYGAFIVLDVLKWNVIAGVFFHVVTWSLAQMPKLEMTESIVWLLDQQMCFVFQCPKYFTSATNKVLYIVFLRWSIGLMWTLESIVVTMCRWRLFRDLEPI